MQNYFYNKKKVLKYLNTYTFLQGSLLDNQE